MTTDELKAKLDYLRGLKRERDNVQRVFKDLDAAWHRQMDEVREILEDSGISSLRTEAGGHEAPEPTWYATVQDFDAFKAWAAEHQPALLRIDKRVSAQMNKLIRECKDDNQPLPPGLGAYPKKVVRCTK